MSKEAYEFIVDDSVEDSIQSSSNKDISEFFEEYYPEAVKEFSRYQRRNELPAVGTKVSTLIPGYGGPRGVTRYVVKNSDFCLEISEDRKGKGLVYICEAANWWRHLEITAEPKQ